MANRPPIAWNDSQRRVLIFLLAITAGYIAFRLMRDSTQIENPQPPRPLRETELADRIDPNTADVATLAALPGVGMKRAADIVTYREEFARANPGRRAFAQLDDLLKIRGIGYAMMMQLSPYLYFPTIQPATSQASR